MKDLGTLDELQRDSDDDIEELVYPINIHESLRAASGMQKGEKTSLFVSLWVFVNAIATWMLASWLRTVTPQHYMLVTILILLTIQATLGVYLLSFILDERGLASEMDNSNLLFTNYFNIYRELREGEESPYPFDVIEFGDGAHVVFIQCLLGYNTQAKSESTYLSNAEAEQILTRSGLPYRKIFSNEKFRGSLAANQLMMTLKGIEEQELFKTYRQIMMELFEIAENESNVMCVTYAIHAQTRLQKDEFASVVNKMLLALERGDTAYREINVLNYDETIEFLRRNYGLDVLDMGLVRARQAIKKQVNCSVALLKLRGKSGKVYSTKDFTRMKDNLIKQFGIK